MAALSVELPSWITPTIAGLTVGAIVGVVGFVAVLLLVGRERKPQRRMMPAPLGDAGSGLPDNVVFIPPYTTLPRDTPVPAPWMGQHPSTPPTAFPAAAPSAPPSPYPISASGNFPVAPNRGAPPLRPSTELSARVFAKMGYEVDAPPPPQTLRSEPPPAYVATSLEFAPPPADAPSADPELELDESELQPEEELAVNHPVTVAPVMLVTSPPPQETLVMSSSILSNVAAQQQAAPLPPAPPAVIPRTSSAMRVKAASVADLDLDDDDAKTQLKASAFEEPKRGASIADLDLEDNGQTQICETIFDEPPQPRRRSDPPKIRPKAPAPPRFPSGASLPRVTTPSPGRVARSNRA